MIDLAIDIATERRVGLKFEEFPQRAHASLLEKITSLTRQLEERVRAAEPYKSGKLRGATTSRIDDRPERITGRVFISADYGKAAALEYGAHAATQVKAHSARLDHVYANAVSPLTVMISAHSRKLDIAEHKYLRGPLEAMEGEIIEQLRAALVEATEASA